MKILHLLLLLSISTDLSAMEPERSATAKEEEEEEKDLQEEYWRQELEKNKAKGCNTNYFLKIRQQSIRQPKTPLFNNQQELLAAKEEWVQWLENNKTKYQPQTYAFGRSQELLAQLANSDKNSSPEDPNINETFREILGLKSMLDTFKKERTPKPKASLPPRPEKPVRTSCLLS